jgi:diguanylate cyclase (GGDEF)-like protein
MNNTIINNITKSTANHIENTLKFYDKLKNNIYLDDSFQDIKNYFDTLYQVDNFKMSLKDDSNLKNILEFEHNLNPSNNGRQLNFLVNVNDKLHITYSFCMCDEAHLNNINSKKEDINNLFNLISPIIYFTYLKEVIEELKLTDNVTKLYNRTYLVQHLEKMLPLAQREEKKIGFLMVGIDHFKAVIDEFDYEIGDKVLLALANVLKDTVRTSDIVVKLGADEFLVVLHNVVSENNAIMVAQKLIKSFKQTKVIVNEKTQQMLMKTICIGISIFPDDSVSIDQILKNADVSLYEARNKGRNQALLYSNTQTNVIEFF